jgi:transcriptional regulator with XRE-family HTH domain
MLSAVVTRERHRDRGTRRARASLAELGRELREARRGAGLRQADVARIAGVSSSWVSQIERGTAADVSFRLLGVLLAIVGLDLSVRAFPGGSPLRDDGHRRLLGRFRSLLPQGAPWRMEVPLPDPGDQRAWDAMTELWHLRVGVEAELRPTDLQAMQRRIALKKRDGFVDRVVLVLADTRHNRWLIRHLGDALRASFPIQRHAARMALQSPSDPGADLLVLV